MSTDPSGEPRSRWSTLDDGNRGLPYRRSAWGGTTQFGDAPDTLPDASLQAASQAKVMMVDDEELTIEVLKAFLEEAGYSRFVSTCDSREAMELLYNERPDVLLLDLSMPHIGGFEILAWMQADRILKHVPVVILTAAADSTNKLRALELGATDFLAKPVDASELALRLRNTLAAKSYRDSLEHSDGLTGLPNRARYLDRLDWALRHAKRHGTVGAVLQIGLDRFRQVNDALGPGAADRLLVGVAQRLRECVRESDYLTRAADESTEPLLARLGGDEFSVLLPALAGVNSAATVAQRILDAVATPYSIAGQELFATCCVGIAVFPGDGLDKDALIKSAGVAMRHAKQQRRDSYHFYSRELNELASARLTLEREFHRAIERDELRPIFQPKFDLKTGRVSGGEALVRWQHPTRGLLGAGEFVPMAEDTGLVVPLGTWMLRATCRQIAGWSAAGLQPGRIAVNLSSHQFREPSLLQTVREALDDAAIAPAQLRLEITESSLMDPDGKALATLRAFADAGIKLSIDDFGTGYSSLSYLKRFPVDELKIDRSFVNDIGLADGNEAIVVAIIAMGHSLGLRIVAEGIETHEQLAFLRAHGCDEGQGYLFSRPVSADEFAQLLVAPPSLETPR